MFLSRSFGSAEVDQKENTNQSWQQFRDSSNTTGKKKLSQHLAATGLMYWQICQEHVGESGHAMWSLVGSNDMWWLMPHLQLQHKQKYSDIWQFCHANTPCISHTCWHQCSKTVQHIIKITSTTSTYQVSLPVEHPANPDWRHPYFFHAIFLPSSGCNTVHLYSPRLKVTTHQLHWKCLVANVCIEALGQAKSSGKTGTKGIPTDNKLTMVHIFIYTDLEV